MRYTVEAWYRCKGGNDSDYIDEQIEAENDVEALVKAKNLRRFVFKVRIVTPELLKWRQVKFLQQDIAELEKEQAKQTQDGWGSNPDNAKYNEITEQINKKRAEQQQIIMSYDNF